MQTLLGNLKNSKKLRNEFLYYFMQEANPFDAYDMMNEGDYVITISSCAYESNSPLNAKILNDYVGADFTDKVAEIRNKILINEFKDLNPVLQSFKEVVFVSKTKEVDAVTVSRAKDLFRASLIDLCNNFLKGENIDAQKQETLTSLKEKVQSDKNCLDFVYGISHIKKLSCDILESYKLKRWYLTESFINARILNIVPEAVEESGDLFELVFEKVRRFVKDFGDKTIETIDGQGYKIYIEDKKVQCDEYTPCKLNLNYELVFLVRKKELKVKEDKRNQEIYSALRDYLELISVFGVMFYYTHSDLFDENFMHRVRARSGVIKRLRMGSTKMKKRALRFLLFRDFYSPCLLSRLKFDFKIRKVLSGNMLVLDVQGLGSKDLVDCDSIARFLSKISSSKMPGFEELLIEIFAVRGDEITKNLRADMYFVLKQLRDNGHEDAIAYRRGDSMYIYTPKSKISPSLLTELKKQFNNEFRLVTVPIPENGFSDSEEYMNRLGLVFMGEDFSKDIEKMSRSLEEYFDFYIDLDDKYLSAISVDESGTAKVIDQRSVQEG